ncbi:iron donor protein CyaY [Uliginosibacterium sp. 31-16]|nr:iron donor protein CyaY [Uliginosibacterium sp. 31-16]MDP5238617.1 iron donor protein CyaY [Uliginosibacterium sp. 31-16]
MGEEDFLAAAETLLLQLEDAIEAAAAAAEIDIDIEVQPGGILQLEFEDGSQIIINRHAAAREIWVAARLGGFHFRPEGKVWVGTRDGLELWTSLSKQLSLQAGVPVVLARRD